MKFCNHEKKDKAEGSGHSHLSHLRMMVICCGAPLLILILIPLIGTNFTALKFILAASVPFLCPALMGGMMLFMFLRSRHRKGEDN
jgi:hypothetical protein